MASENSSSPLAITSHAAGVTTAREIEAMKKSMFKKIMRGLWEDLVEIYKKPEAQEAKVGKSGDTALHLAVFDGEVEIVHKLVKLIPDSNASRILQIKNNRGNTVLHLAAALGTVEMCNCIAQRDPSLVGIRNHESETPLFLAALHGKKDAFLCLHSKCQNASDGGYSYCRRNDGETILHCAINGEYFELACLIIRLYGDLVNFNNENGLSPLHLLASKPSAFKSGSRLRRFDLMIYYCIFVDHPNAFTDNYYSKAHVPKSHYAEEISSPLSYYPNNYLTCLAFFQILKKLIFVIVSSKRVKDGNTPDAENLQIVTETSAGAQQGRRPIEQENNQSSNTQNERVQSSYELWAARHQLYPPNYITFVNFLKLAMKVLLVVLGLGFSRVRKIKEKKEKHAWATLTMEELIERVSEWDYENNGGDPRKSSSQILDYEATTFTMEYPPSTLLDNGDPIGENKHKKGGRLETPILIAARMGVMEMVEKILDTFPTALQDVNWEKKNIALLAVENRQPHVYDLLLKRKILNESVFRVVDNKGNSALHLAATLGDFKPWLIPGAALQMQWEIRWYKFVKESKPRNYFVQYNNRGKTPKQVFSETHKGLVTEGGQWLASTSESCSVVAALIATVAFATAATVPGGLNSDSGKPILEGHPAFDLFAISSLVALCFSVTSVIMFLAILTSRYEERDFESDLPKKLIIGLSSLFISIASMLVSFCAGHFFVLKDKLRIAAYPLYAATTFPVAFFVAAQFPLYIDLIRASLKKVPQRSYKVIPMDVEQVAYSYMDHDKPKKSEKKERKDRKEKKSKGKSSTTSSKAGESSEQAGK